MTSVPRAFFAVDVGSATVSAALIGRVGGHWRLLTSVAFPAVVGVEAALSQLVARVEAADPSLGSEISLDVQLPRLVARSAPTPTMAVLGASHRQVELLSAVAGRSGWRTVSGSPDRQDGLSLTRLALDRTVTAVLAGSGDPPAGDERRGLPELAAVVSGIAHRRPGLPVVLAGAMADFASTVDGRAGDERREPNVLVAPHATAGDRPGAPLRQLLDGLRAGPDDSRRGVARAVASLALVLDRRLEAVEIGFDGGLHCSAWPRGESAAGESPAEDGQGQPSATDSDDRQPRDHVDASWAIIAAAALVPPEVDDQVVDGVNGWSTVAVDRHRLRDRLRELRLDPWAEAHGEGALLRLAAARAALRRLVEHTPEFETLPPPDVLIAAGGAWSCAPGPAVALALADAFRRPGAYQLAYDHARLLGPIGTIESEADRRRLLVDLADDILTPLGSVVLPQGLRAGKSAGQLVVHAGVGTTELDLIPGGLELVDLPAGQTATAEMRFKDPVLLGTVGRTFAVEFAGGLGGLLVDLRDVPLRFPERIERRRQLLEAWQRALWMGMDG